MSITSSKSSDGKSVSINITGNFDYSCHSDFRDSYKDMPGGTEYIVNMSGASYMDSSALGMLLLLREHAGGDSANISIRNCDSEIKKILEISNFDKLFKIS